jgi:hypothetical protein
VRGDIRQFDEPPSDPRFARVLRCPATPETPSAKRTQRTGEHAWIEFPIAGDDSVDGAPARDVGRGHGGADREE